MLHHRPSWSGRRCSDLQCWPDSGVQTLPVTVANFKLPTGVAGCRAAERDTIIYLLP